MPSSTDTTADTSAPKYRILCDRMIADVRAGRLADGERLAPERELAKQLGVSRITIRGALSQLERVGYVERRQGSGTYINARPRVQAHEPVRTGQLILVYGQVHGDRSLDRFLGELLQGLDACLHATGRVPQFICQPAGQPPDERLMSMVAQSGIQVLLCGYDPGKEFLTRLIARGDRVASMGPLRVAVPGVTIISGRHEEAAFWATSHLLDHGYKRIALLNGPYSLYLAHEQLAGYRRAHAKHKKSVVDSLVVELPVWRAESGRQLARRIACGELKVDAVLCYGDWAMLGLADELRNHGLNIGSDIPVIAGDWYAWLDEALPVGLSGLHESRETLVRSALAALSDTRADRPDLIRVPIDLRLRSSCGCAKESAS